MLKKSVSVSNPGAHSTLKISANQNLRPLLSSGFYLLGGGSFPPPLQKKSFTEKKNLQLFQMKIFFDDDFKESVKVTNVQKCDFSQS